MRVGILGSGLMGGKLGTIFASAGHEVVFAYARTEQKLKRFAREAKGNAQAGTPAEAVHNADAIVLAVGSPVTPSRLRCSSRSSRTKEKVVRNCRIVSNGSGDNGAERMFRTSCTLYQCADRGHWSPV